eukprot:TRINITY_DN6807_c1_g1_i1.p1 TRINITY_DN6807_c1_g1~~TRINITY_DN6807_c1_g1_i1.p1  ORF type:complete len:374 (-),score=142.24 TRINITY_DN6807_c1_g1_i1:32-1153(-)
MAVGTEMKQPNSEFVYEMRYRNSNALKRKLSRGLSQGELEEEVKKKQKLEEELQRIQNLQSELENNKNQLAEEAIRLQKKKEEIEEKEREEKEVNDRKEKEIRQLHKQNSKTIEELQRLQESQKALEDEKNRILREQQEKVEESERIKKQLEEKIQKEEELEEEITCLICSDLIAIARTLQCSHSFCGNCIHQWIKKSNTCPFCKEPIKELIRSRVLDNAIEKIVAGLPKEDQDRFEERVNLYKGSEKEFELVEKEQAQVNQLTKRIARYKKKGKIFTPSLLGKWSDNDRRKFFNQFTTYNCQKSRALFCETGGLTPKFVNESNVILLKQAAVNIGLKMLGIEYNGQELKRRLLKFIDGTLEPGLINALPPKH